LCKLLMNITLQRGNDNFQGIFMKC